MILKIGNMGSWAATHGYLAMPMVSLFSITWYLAIAANALGPAYQVEATSQARKRLRIFVGRLTRLAIEAGPSAGNLKLC